MLQGDIHHLHKMYYLYYLILLCSSLLYFSAFSNEPKKLSILLFFGLSHLIMVHFIEVVGKELYVISNRRFLPVLSIIPTLHILLTVLENKYRIFSKSFIIFLQTVSLFLIIHFRSSTEYQILIIVFFSIYLIIFNRKNLYEAVSIKKDMTLVLFFILITHITFKSFLFLYKSPYYHLDRTGHLFWHAAYIGLSSHPESMEKYNIYPEFEDTSLE